MSGVASIEHTGGSKEKLNSGVRLITDDDFIRARVHPVLGGASPGANGFRCESSVVQNTGTGRLTLRYDFGNDQIIYGKLFTDELGKSSYDALKLLWDNGFGKGSRYQVSEPLAFDPELNLLLMRGVAGTHVGAALDGNTSVDLIEGSREAARWLARLHRSPVKLGELEADWDSLKIFRLCVRLMKAAAAHPAQSAQLLDLMHLLKDRVKAMPAKRMVALTHGRYHHEHVYLSPNTISVIDMDRVRPTDPAKDIAEYVRVMRIAAFKLDGNLVRADQATRAFLDEYFAQVPEAHKGLAFHWSAFIVLSLLGFSKRLKLEDPRREPLLNFHHGELERAMKYAEEYAT